MCYRKAKSSFMQRSAVQCCAVRQLLCIKNAANTNQEGSEFHTDLDDGDGEAQRIIFSNEPICAI